MKFRKNTWLQVIGIAAVVAVMAVMSGCSEGIEKVPAQDSYHYVNPDPLKAQTDAGIVIDGVLDEAAYQENNWLYLHNDDGGNNVNIAMTSHFGEQGMYFVYDVTESVPIYVNKKRNSYMNSCIEMYLAPPNVNGVQENSVFEIDLLPTGDMTFKKSNGRYGYVNVATSGDKMACLGATTKGGPVNTPECYGYTLELFIPWDYMQWLEMDVRSMRDSYVYVNPAHITSNNLNGTDTNLDRYWYHYAQQYGADFTDVFQYFRFNSEGVIGTVPVTTQAAEHCTISGQDAVIPGMMSLITITPESGHTLTSVLVNGQEQINRIHYNEDGSCTLQIRGGTDGITVSAKAEPTAEGNKTLSGRVIVKDLSGGSLNGVIVTYTGPTGEKPLEIDSKGNFALADLATGYYVIKAEKEGYTPVNRGIYLDKDIYTELELEYVAFYSTKGSCWILDKQNEGILQKVGGTGHVMGNRSYNNFTYTAYLKYDEDLAKQGTTDFFRQQRSGMRIMFSNDKYWHIDLLKEKDQYILQYAKHTGNDSVFNWRTVRKLTAAEIAKYTSEDGICLKVMRQGRHAAVWLNGTLLVIELLGEEYTYCSAQLGMEAWVANRTIMEVPFSISAGVPVDVAGSAFHWPAEIWDITDQYNGTVSKFPAPGKDTWLDSKIDANDVTTISKDLSPETNDYSMIYIFKFSNGENFRVRLNHTDNDGKYRIQSFAGSTLFEAWKNHYTLTDEQAEKVKTDGIAYRVQILGTTAYVFLDDVEVCTYDLSKVIATGKPSGIENATVRVSFRLDGNTNGVTVIPFKLENNAQEVSLDIAQMENGAITADQDSYNVGDTVKLTVAGAEGYYYSELYVDGQPVTPDWDGSYRFTATKNKHTVTGGFKKGLFAADGEGHWNLTQQNRDMLRLEAHASGNSGFLKAGSSVDDISTTVKDLTPGEKDFSMIYNFTFSNGETFNLRLNHTDNDGAYRIQSMSGSTLFAPWKNHYTLTDAEAAKVQSEGVQFRVVIKNTTAYVYMDDVQVCTYDLSKVVATGTDSGIAAAEATVAIRMDGNLNQTLEVPFRAVDTAENVELIMEAFENGTVTANQSGYQIGDTVVLTITPNSGYSQKVTLDGAPLLLDWKTNTYSFVAEKASYVVAGSFEESLDIAPSDANRWDSSNQAHGVISTYYPNNNDSWWCKIHGAHEFLAVNAKNYLPQADSAEGNGKTGFSVVLAVTMDNGKTYAFRFINEKQSGTDNIRYVYTRYGASGSVTGWGGWCELEAKIPGITEKLQGDGAEFKLIRTGANTLRVTLDGVALDTYTMDGVTAANKITSYGIYHYGNKGQKVDIPFALTNHSDAAPVKVTVPTLANGKVAADRENYRVGDTITLTVMPNAGYSQKLTINGAPLLLDWKTNTYSFVAEKESYVIAGSFEKSFQDAPFDVNRWDSSNQAHGVISTYYPSNNDSWWYKINGDFDAIAVNAKNYLPQADSAEGNGKTGFSVVLAVTLDNGKFYAFRFINEKQSGTGNVRYVYTRYGAYESVTGWGGWCELEAKVPGVTAKLQGDGAEFKLIRTSANTLQITLDGVVLDTYIMDGVTAANKVVSVGIYHYGNKGEKVEIPFAVK